jgi:hypothetical protein
MTQIRLFDSSVARRAPHGLSFYLISTGCCLVFVMGRRAAEAPDHEGLAKLSLVECLVPWQHAHSA